jgi:hypothetical protein
MKGWRNVRRAAGELFVRAAKTAVQTFGSLVTIDAMVGGFNPSLIESAAVTAGAAALAVFWNAALAWSRT